MLLPGPAAVLSAAGRAGATAVALVALPGRVLRRGDEELADADTLFTPDASRQGATRARP